MWGYIQHLVGLGPKFEIMILKVVSQLKVSNTLLPLDSWKETSSFVEILYVFLWKLLWKLKVSPKAKYCVLQESFEIYFACVMDL